MVRRVSVLGIPPDDSQRRAFGHADERPYRRSPGDCMRLVLATVVVAVTHRLFTTYLPPIGATSRPRS